MSQVLSDLPVIIKTDILPELKRTSHVTGIHGVEQIWPMAQGIANESARIYKSLK